MSYGAEFCPRRLPEAAAVVAVASACAGAGRGFTLVTPVVREGSLETLQRYLETVAAHTPGVECVLNDWGALDWVAREGLPLRLTAGRLLSRQRRDPRVLAQVAKAGSDEVLALRSSVWEDGSSLALLHDLGVVRVELDFLLQGTTRPNLPEGMSLSVHAPWLPVTVTPACRFAENPARCAGDCRRYAAVHQENDQEPHPLWCRGNTLFVRSELQPPYQEVAKLGADRLVWAEVLPG